MRKLLLYWSVTQSPIPTGTTALDALHEKFESLCVVQAILSEADKDELKSHVDQALQTLQAGLQERAVG